MSSQLEKLALMMMHEARWCERYVVIVVYGEHDMVGRASWLWPGRYSSESVQARIRHPLHLDCTNSESAPGLGLAVPFTGYHFFALTGYGRSSINSLW